MHRTVSATTLIAQGPGPSHFVTDCYSPSARESRAADPVPPWLEKIRQQIAPQRNVSPLVLDLDGDGVEVSALDQSRPRVYFDLDNDGMAENLAWVTGGDGLLCRDLNGNGLIDNGNELLGSASVDGFAKLAALYSTRDRRINQPRVCNKSTLFPLHGTRGCAISGRVRTRNIFATALAA
ncbi:MAG: hypothetical protein IPI58_00860 [Alphaproteobacteria bacterium]|nr:MAG: hypothetical protein IPI58_00860 [Alphaproteobacteria bacterium]